MNSAPADNRESVTVQAARWLARVHAQDMSAEYARDLRAWIDAAPEHGEAWRQMERLWYVTGAIADDPAIAAVRDIEEGNVAAARPSPLRIRGWLTAAAASIALAFAGTWAIDVDGPLASLRGDSVAGVQVLRTGVGQRSLVTLSDGSVVTLDTDSEVRVEAMTASRRLSLTRGRAYFQVAPDKTRPFLVEAAGAKVRALGTAFSVQIDSDKLTVTLVEGRIVVEEPGSLFHRGMSADMMPGAELTAGTADEWIIKPVDADQRVSWVDGQLTFLREPLASAMAEVNRYSEQKVVFTNGKVPDQRIVGAFRTGDVESFARAAEMSGFGRIVARTPRRIELSSE